MSKRAKLTADKARERITSLEESVSVREGKLEQLKSRIARSSNPDEKLLAAQERLERRIELEQEQIQKLKRLLGRQPSSAGQESSEYYGEEELEDLHRSFEEVRQDLSQVKMKLESADLPRDLPSRLTSFEERISRREEVASDLYGQILNLESALDQERQTVRRLSRRIREQDQNIEALREAVEDSVVATVDMVERLENLEERNSEAAVEEEVVESNPLAEQLEAMQRRLEELEERLEATNTNNSEEILLEALDDFDSRLEGIERLAKDNAEAVRFVSEERPALAQAEPAAVPSNAIEVPTPAAEQPAVFEAPVAALAGLTVQEEKRAGWVPATFAGGGTSGKLTARWQVANFHGKKNGK